jgi:cell wall-associated NlpC family hydrolase
MNKKTEILKLAKDNLGKPYKYGAKLEEAPSYFDCSSFVQYLYKQIDIDLPRTALDQAAKGTEISKNDPLEIGDLIFIKGSWGHYNPEFPEGIGHVAMYIGDGKTVSARWKENDGSVIEENVNDYLSRKDLRTIKRIL